MERRFRFTIRNYIDPLLRAWVIPLSSPEAPPSRWLRADMVAVVAKPPGGRSLRRRQQENAVPYVFPKKGAAIAAP